MYTVRAVGHTATKCVGGHANRFFTLLRHWANRSVESVSAAQVSAPLTEDTAWLGSESGFGFRFELRSGLGSGWGSGSGLG